ncbi:MAG TPA: hypothetical protein VGL86_11065 [Polyangia bacterium]
MGAPRWRALAPVAAAVAVAALRFATRAHGPDSWDAVGFLRAVDDFDLARFQPHFPGYAVYVALCKIVRSPELVSAIATGATALALFRLGGWVALALWAGALQPWLTGGAALADATAVAFAAAAFAALTFPGARAVVLAAAAIALAIGTRVSYWPLALSFAVVVVRVRPQNERRAALAAFAAATLAWLVPFVAAVGPRALVVLGRTHLVGHFADWGGAVTTRPDLAARLAAFARDLVYDGIWPDRFALGAALAGCAILCWPWRRPSAVGVIVVVPYALWALLAQNVLEQPRHLLPLVAALCVAVGRAAARSRRGLVVGAALAALAFAASAPLVIHRGPPAAVVVAERVAARWPGRDQVIVFARRSARLMSAAVPAVRVQTADATSDILPQLERLARLPPNILFVAEELADDDPAASASADDGLHFCRDPRVDRQSTCVTLRSYKLAK